MVVRVSMPVWVYTSLNVVRYSFCVKSTFCKRGGERGLVIRAVEKAVLECRGGGLVRKYSNCRCLPSVYLLSELAISPPTP